MMLSTATSTSTSTSTATNTITTCSSSSSSSSSYLRIVFSFSALPPWTKDIIIENKNKNVSPRNL